MGKLKELWVRLRGTYQEPTPEPVIEEEEEEAEAPELTDDEILAQIFHKLRKPREVIMVSIHDKGSPDKSTRRDLALSWAFPQYYKHLKGNTLLQELCAMKWRFEMHPAQAARARVQLRGEWGALMIGIMPKFDDLAPTEVYLRLANQDTRLVNPVTHLPTQTGAALLNQFCLLTSMQVMTSLYFNGEILFRLKPAISHGVYDDIVSAMKNVDDTSGKN